MKELREISEAWRALEAAGQEAVLATVVRTRGSTYRKVGARMLVTETEWVAGAISGGCVERDLLRKAFWRTTEGRALITYDGAAEPDEGGFGLGCDGSIDVLLERLRPGMALDPLRPVRAALEARTRSVVVTALHEGFGRLVLSEDGTVATDLPLHAREPLLAAARAVLAGEAPPEQLACELLEPPLSLVIFGSNYDALPLVRFATALGWDVTVVEKRPAASLQPPFAIASRILTGRAPEVVSRALGQRAAVVVMTHHYEEDRELLRALLPRDTRYLGVLGPRARTERLLAELGATDEARARLHGPIGLDLGGRAPEEVALSIVAQVQACVHGRGAGALRARA